MVYFDTSYLVRLYIKDPGAEAVRKLAATTKIACSFHGEIETIAALHRAYREAPLTRAAYIELLDQFHDDSEAGSFTWLVTDKDLRPKLEEVYRNASSKFFLRAADALHLACARQNGFKEVYSHDKRMLAAAPAFGLTARNVIK
jgi:predicted nucleic acid-binding protein